MALYSDSLADMRGAVKEIKPNASVTGIDGWINKRIRKICQAHPWSDLLRVINFRIPSSYHTGKVSVTGGSSIVAGTGTAWAFDDLINTVCNLPIRAPGFTKVKAASMAGIVAGQWLLIDRANSTQMEAVAVEHVGKDYFISKFLKTHDGGFTISASSLAGRQFRCPYPIYTIKAVIDATTLWLDGDWADASVAAQSYEIVLAYMQPDPYCTRIHFGFDSVQGIKINSVNCSFAKIISGDPQLTASNDPQALVPIQPGAGGVSQWLIYPIQTGERSLSVVMSTTWPKLIDHDDRPPSFISPDLIVSGAAAEALRVKVIPSGGKTDPYWDLQTSGFYEDEFIRDLDLAQQADEGRSAHALQEYESQYGGSATSDLYEQTHPWV